MNREYENLSPEEFVRVLNNALPRLTLAFNCAFALVNHVGGPVAKAMKDSDEVRLSVRAKVREFYPDATDLQQLQVSVETAQIILKSGLISSCMIWDLAHFIWHTFTDGVLTRH